MEASKISMTLYMVIGFLTIQDIKSILKMRLHSIENLMKSEKCAFHILMLKPGLPNDTIIVLG